MRLGLKLLLVAIALVVIGGVVSGVWMWTGGQAKADNGAKEAEVEKSDAPKAPAVKADDDDVEEEVEGDDDDDGDDDEDGGKEEDEVKLTIDQVPAAVRDAILAEAGNNPIKEIEAETKGGQTVYEAEWIAGGKEIELKLTADGTVIKKKVEDADDDKEEKGEH